VSKTQKPHPYIKTLKQQLGEGKVDRREFLRTATLLGVSATAAYHFADTIEGLSPIRAARAEAMPQGGVLKIGMRVQEITTPHNMAWADKSNQVRAVCEYLTKTGYDNITRPYLLEGWEASEDLQTWTLRLRKGIKWHNGRDFVAEDVIWNLNDVLDPASGSSVLGLMKGYMLEEYDTGEKDENGKPVMSTRLWDANAIEKVDDHTVRLNAKASQLAVPEHLFHYPLPILDPEEGGNFNVGSNGTGPFEFTEQVVGNRAVFKARKDYWGEGPYVDVLEYHDLGDDPSAYINALASQQLHGIDSAGATQIPVLKQLPHLQLYETATAETGVVRGKVSEKPFDDPKVRKALKLAIDSEQVMNLTIAGLGEKTEHTHVCPIHPEYHGVPGVKRDVEAAKKLLAEAGYPDGVDLDVSISNDPDWMPNAMQVMVQQWQEAGIRVKINKMPGSQFWDIWDKVPFGFTIWYHRPLGVMVLGLGYRSGVPWNESEYSNKEFDELLAQAEGTLDVDERRKIMGKLEKIMYEDGPITQPFWKSVVTFYDKRVKGAGAHPTNYIFAEGLAVES
jgi:peptide/nickel transport system substrate-binding protein